MALTPEERAAALAEMEALLLPPKPRPMPKLATVNGLTVVQGRMKKGDRFAGEVFVDPRVENHIEADRYAAALDHQRRRNELGHDPYAMMHTGGRIDD